MICYDIKLWESLPVDVEAFTHPVLLSRFAYSSALLDSDYDWHKRQHDFPYSSLAPAQHPSGLTSTTTHDYLHPYQRRLKLVHLPLDSSACEMIILTSLSTQAILIFFSTSLLRGSALTTKNIRNI